MVGKLDQSRGSRSPDRTSESAPRNHRGSVTRGSVNRGSVQTNETLSESAHFANLGSLGVISPECGTRGAQQVGLAGALSFKGSGGIKPFHLEGN